MPRIPNKLNAGYKAPMGKRKITGEKPGDKIKRLTRRNLEPTDKYKFRRDYSNHSDMELYAILIKEINNAINKRPPERNLTDFLNDERVIRFLDNPVMLKYLKNTDLRRFPKTKPINRKFITEFLLGL